MVVFEHNKHQIDECKSLSESLGFKSFQYRNSDRTNTIAVDKTGRFGYPITSPDLNIPKKKYIQLLIMEQDLKNLKKGIKTPTPKAPDTKPLPNLETCQSISSKSIYIGSDWAVMPCCFFGGLTVVKQSDYRWNNFKSELDSNGFNINDFYASDTKTVREVFEQGFDWIYNKIRQRELKIVYSEINKPTFGTGHAEIQQLKDANPPNIVVVPQVQHLVGEDPDYVLYNSVGDVTKVEERHFIRPPPDGSISEIVKANLALYQAGEDAREASFKQKSADMQEWRKYHDVYVRAAKCFAQCEHLDLNLIGIFDARSLEEYVDDQEEYTYPDGR
jgi:hypothetical protein